MIVLSVDLNQNRLDRRIALDQDACAFSMSTLTVWILDTTYLLQRAAYCLSESCQSADSR
jgi:hypothetical protein